MAIFAWALVDDTGEIKSDILDIVQDSTFVTYVAETVAAAVEPALAVISTPATAQQEVANIIGNAVATAVVVLFSDDAVRHYTAKLLEEPARRPPGYVEGSC